MESYDHEIALSEGWDIFECDEPHRLEIQRLDDPQSVEGLGYNDPKFPNDEAAVEHVFTQLRAGSAYHAAALDALDAGNKAIREGRA